MDASQKLELPVEALPKDAVPEEPRAEVRLELDWHKIVSSPAFLPGIALVIGIVASFWSMIGQLPGIWFADDGYYSHGILVPFISAYVVYRWWPSLVKIPVKPAYLSLFLLIPFLYFVVRPSAVNDVIQLSSVCLILTLLLGIAFIAGWRWMLALTLP